MLECLFAYSYSICDQACENQAYLHKLHMFSANFQYAIPSLLYTAVQFAIPTWYSKCPIAFYTHLVSFTNIRSILSNRTHSYKLLHCKNQSKTLLRLMHSWFCRLLKLHFVIFKDTAFISSKSFSINTATVVISMPQCADRQIDRQTDGFSTL